MHLNEEALSRMDNEGGASLPATIPQDAITAGLFAEGTHHSMPPEQIEHTAEMFKVYTRLAEQWDARATETPTLTHGALPVAA